MTSPEDGATLVLIAHLFRADFIVFARIYGFQPQSPKHFVIPEKKHRIQLDLIDFATK